MFIDGTELRSESVGRCAPWNGTENNLVVDKFALMSTVCCAVQTKDQMDYQWNLDKTADCESSRFWKTFGRQFAVWEIQTGVCLLITRKRK